MTWYSWIPGHGWRCQIERICITSLPMLRKKYQDKPDISFTDFTSFIIMQELAINKVFTGDAHFGKVNVGFEILPK